MTPIHPRHHIDIGLGDLAFGLAQCARPLPQAQESVARDLEEAIDDSDAWIATLSVRSAFDLLLTSLALPEGSEVLLSALTIPHMAEIVAAHGLVPVPVDLDADTLSPTTESLTVAWSPRARVLVVAQLFGAAADFDASARFCKERDMLLVNDNAQGYVGPKSLREAKGDVAFFSFGSIKTATCLGGALTRVHAPALLRTMRKTQAAWPVQPTKAYAQKLAQYAALRVPSDPRAYGVFERVCETFGSGLDDMIMSMTRGFPTNSVDELLRRVRHRPCAALLRLLDRRRKTFDHGRVHRRALAGQRAAAHLGADICVIGGGQPHRTHWLFALSLDNPAHYMRPLRARGFDSARGTTSITAVAAPASRPETEAHTAQRIMDRLLFVPMYPEMPEVERVRLVDAIRALRRAQPDGDAPRGGHAPSRVSASAAGRWEEPSTYA